MNYIPPVSVIILQPFPSEKGDTAVSIKKQFLKSKPVCKVTFKITEEQAKHAKCVRLLGEFNDWNKSAKPMKKLKKRHFYHYR